MSGFVLQLGHFARKLVFISMTKTSYANAQSGQVYFSPSTTRPKILWNISCENRKSKILARLCRCTSSAESSLFIFGIIGRVAQEKGLYFICGT